MASRLLLGPGHSHGGRVVEENHAGEAQGHAEDVVGHLVHASTLDLRIAAIFVVWFGAVLFGVPTLAFKQFRDPDAVIPRLLRAFAGGVIVSLALVHIIPSAVGELNSLMVFPIGGCTILFGIIVLVLVDNCLSAFLAPEQYKQQIRNDLAAKKEAAGHAEKHDVAHKQHDHHAGDAAAAVHGHQCLRSMSASGWVASEARPSVNIRQYVTAYTMELGCIFHSIIIGVGVGVITDDRPLVVTLMVALAIHQGLEALALGSVLALTSFHNIKKIFMLLIYTITTPIGIAIGIAVAAGYDPDSVTSRAVQGTLNGVSGGMLLYIGMYQLIAEEFSREDILVRPKMRYGMYAGLLLGAASMCILGIWA